jgi:tol-pal system protein YbgF
VGCQRLVFLLCLALAGPGWGQEAPVYGPAEGPPEGAGQQGQHLPLEARVAKMERVLSSGGIMELLDEMDKMRKQMQRLRGDLDELRQEITDLGLRQKDYQNNLDRRLESLEKFGAVPVPGVGTPGAAPGTIAPDANPAAGASGITLGTLKPAGKAAPLAVDVAEEGTGPEEENKAGEPDKGGKGDKTDKAEAKGKPGTGPIANTEIGEAADVEYHAAVKLLQKWEYQLAIKAFGHYLETYPRHVRADNGRFWLGEAYRMSRKHEHAIAEYRRLLQDYPKSQKAPQARVKIGESLIELGKTAQARKELEEVRRTYPGTDAARLAEAALRGLPVAGAGAGAEKGR